MINSLLSELGRKLAERWLSLLVLPGALYLSVAAAAHTLGHAHPFDLNRLTQRVTAWANEPAVSGVGGQVVLLAAVLAGAAAVGCAVQGSAALLERIMLAADWRDWPRPLRWLTVWRVERRTQRWQEHAVAWHRHREHAAVALARGRRTDPSERRAAYRAMTRIAAERPDRPTWCGDRLNAVAIRLERDHHLDLSTCWPHLWLILPEATRLEITAARQALVRATGLIAWALLYLPLAVWWWPGAALGLTLALAGRHRARAATDIYALLLEAAVHVHVRDLAEHLGLERDSSPDEMGNAITRRLEGTPPPPAQP